MFISDDYWNEEVNFFEFRIDFLGLYLELQRLLDVITELEKLKPEVQKKVDQYNSAFLKVTPASYSSPSTYSTPSSYNFPSSYSVPPPYNLPSSHSNTLPSDREVAWPPNNRNQSFSGGINQDKVCRNAFGGMSAFWNLVFGFGVQFRWSFLDTQAVR